MIAAILWDLDGTIIDSARAVVEASRQVLAERLGVAASEAELLAHWSLPASQRFARYDPGRADELAAAYVERYTALHDALVRPFPGVLEVLAAVRARGLGQAIVTSKRRRATALAVEAFQLDRVIEAIVTDEDVARHKPAPDGIVAAAAHLEVAPEACAMVGDSVLDVRAARAAGARAVVARWGAVALEAALAERPDAVLARPHDLLGLLHS